VVYTNAAKLPVRRALAIWAGLAIVLVLFSYLLTLSLALACVYFPFLLLSASPGLNTLVVFLAGVVVSIVILWSLLPRKDTFSPPGPRLDVHRHPRLFAELQSIAGELNESVPLEVYLIPDVNAWVTERGGIMGFGSRRVMGLGLPLLGILTTSQFRAVLAHEFGHYYSGDTRLWPFVHKTRAAMARTLGNLGSDSLAQALTKINLARLVHFVAVTILVAYWKVFMRITQAISRLHEYRADELAGNIAGAQSLIDGLTAVHGASAALPLFWRSEMLPALEAGYRPPLANGFAQFIKVPNIAAAVQDRVKKELQEPTTNAYDTHPPLKDRVAALQSNAVSRQDTGNTPAIALLDSLDGIEVELLQSIIRNRQVDTLKAVPWDRIGPVAYVPRWRDAVQKSALVLRDKTIAQLPELVANLNQIAQATPDPVGMLLTRDQRLERAAQLLWMALTVALCDRGWNFHASPGQFYLEHEGRQIAPGEIVTQIRSRTMTNADWIERSNSLGISDIPLASS
jgi:Zn-dependent protease with chaperone function